MCLDDRIPAFFLLSPRLTFEFFFYLCEPMASRQPEPPFEPPFPAYAPAVSSFFYFFGFGAVFPPLLDLACRHRPFSLKTARSVPGRRADVPLLLSTSLFSGHCSLKSRPTVTEPGTFLPYHSSRRAQLLFLCVLATLTVLLSRSHFPVGSVMVFFFSFAIFDFFEVPWASFPHSGARPKILRLRRNLPPHPFFELLRRGRLQNISVADFFAPPSVIPSVLFLSDKTP